MSSLGVLKIYGFSISRDEGAAISQETKAGCQIYGEYSLWFTIGRPPSVQP